jgi:hypothetical protein
VQRLDCDALALLVVRLGSDPPAENGLSWHAWDKTPGAALHSLPEDPKRGSIQPFKRLPREDAWPYFSAHVERLLFPPGNKRGERWLCCPDELHLDIARNARGASRRARIDLLERLTTPLEPGCTFGLIHLSLLPAEEPDDPDTLWWGRAIASTFSRKGVSDFVLQHRDKSTRLDRQRPARSLAKALFGNPGHHLERNLYTALMVSGHDDPTERLALASHRATTKSLTADNRDEEREKRQTVRIADPTGLLLGRCAAFTLTDPIDEGHARNFRSYWTESIVFGLLQQDCLEEFQRRLAGIDDDLLGPGIKKLREDWLKFRNALWWSQLANSSEIPQKLVSRLRNELGTERLFTDLEGDLATYSEYRHQAVEDQQAAALANLQIFGFPIVALGTLAAIFSLFEASAETRAMLVGASSLFFLFALAYALVTLRGRSRRQVAGESSVARRR